MINEIRHNRKIFIWVFWSALLLYMVISSMPTEHVKKISESNPTSLRLDYILHFIVYTVLGILSLFAYPKIGKAGSIMFIFAFVEEGHQYWIPFRTVNIYDLISDIAGIVFVFLVYYFIQSWKRIKKSTP